MRFILCEKNASFCESCNKNYFPSYDEHGQQNGKCVKCSEYCYECENAFSRRICYPGYGHGNLDENVGQC